MKFEGLYYSGSFIHPFCTLYICRLLTRKIVLSLVRLANCTPWRPSILPLILPRILPSMASRWAHFEDVLRVRQAVCKLTASHASDSNTFKFLCILLPVQTFDTMSADFKLHSFFASIKGNIIRRLPPSLHKSITHAASLPGGVGDTTPPYTPTAPTQLLAQDPTTSKSSLDAVNQPKDVCGQGTSPQDKCMKVSVI